MSIKSYDFVTSGNRIYTNKLTWPDSATPNNENEVYFHGKLFSATLMKNL